MTDDRTDDGLAPVTDLFGARSRRRAQRDPDATDARKQAPAATDGPRSDESEWRPPVTGRTRPTLVAVSDVGYGDTADAEHASVFTAVGGADPDRRGAIRQAPDGQEADAADAPRSPEDQAADAERIAMRTLGRRGVSVSELRTALGGHDLDDSVIEHEVERLLGVGLLDDTALANELVDRLRSRKGLGRQGLVAELRRRGVDPLAIDTALADSEADDADQESARALDLAVKRAGQLRGLDRETAERRLSGFLMRKGYGSAAVRNAVRRALDGAGPRGPVRFE